MGGENWETRRGRSRAGLLRSPRDLHLDLATFGARQSLRNLVPLLALLGTALAGGVEVSSSQSTQQKLNADDAAIKGRDDDYMTALATAGYQPNFEERASVSFGALAGARESVIDDAFFASKGDRKS